MANVTIADGCSVRNKFPQDYVELLIPKWLTGITYYTLRYTLLLFDLLFPKENAISLLISDAHFLFSTDLVYRIDSQMLKILISTIYVFNPTLKIYRNIHSIFKLIG